MLTSQQIRAARGLLRWSAQELAERAGVHLATVQRMERFDDTIQAMATTVAKVERAFEAEGVDFLADNGGLGVRLKKRPRRAARRRGRPGRHPRGP